MRLASLAVAWLLVAHPSIAAAQDPPVYKPGAGITAPRLIKDVKPVYTAAAMRARIQGVVVMDSIVLPDGTVGDVWITRSLDAELDAQAVSAVKQWLFTPGTKDGEAVAVVVAVEISFAIRGKKDVAPDVAPVPAPGVIESVIYRVGSGITAPVVVNRVEPQYTERPRREAVQGTVTMKCVILPDGTVGRVRIVKRLDPELDQEAIKAVRQWTFKPGLKDQTPVHVEVDIEMTFTLR